MSRKKIIAILLSLFIVPGAGHIYLGDKKKGYTLALITVSILFGLVIFFEWSLYFATQGVEDPLSSIFVLTKTALTTHSPIYTSTSLLITIIWIYGVVDLIRRGEGAINC